MSKPSSQFLLIDAGNTLCKWATAVPHGPIRPAGHVTTQDVTAVWAQKLAGKYPNYRVVLASVVPRLIPLFRHAFPQRLHVVNGASPALGLHFLYPKPAEIGADRLASAVAAHAQGHWPAIAVNCGTATAFTVLDAKGSLCGGVIAPGLQTQLASLIGATAQLPDVALRPPRRYLGKSTREAIRAGAVLNFQGGVKEILRQLVRELGGTQKPAIYLTGGNTRFLVGALDVPVKMRPLLVFEGLLIIGTRVFEPAHESDFR